MHATRNMHMIQALKYKSRYTLHFIPKHHHAHLTLSEFLLRPSRKPSVGSASSFVAAATSYVWSCLAKSAEAAGEKVDGNENEVFFLTADARGRLNAMIHPPVPFGNCIGGGMVSLEHKLLAAEEGFLTAAEAVAEEIKLRINNKDEFLKSAENWPSEMMKYMGMRSLWVSDSPKFDLYCADFGWGKAKKVEVVTIDAETYMMSLCNSGDSDGGLEVGMSLPEERMKLLLLYLMMV